MNDIINRSAIMEIATYVIADYSFEIEENISMREALSQLELQPDLNKSYIQYLHTAIEFDSTIGDIAFLKTSNGMRYSSTG